MPRYTFAKYAIVLRLNNILEGGHDLIEFVIGSEELEPNVGLGR